MGSGTGGQHRGADADRQNRVDRAGRQPERQTAAGQGQRAGGQERARRSVCHSQGGDAAEAEREGQRPVARTG